MPDRMTILERAYQLARSGACANVSDIKKQLKAERYDRVEDHLSGRLIISTLKRLCFSADRELR
jgi:hypothetical protein